MRQAVELHSIIPKGWISEKLGNLADKITKGATPTTYGYEFQRSGINFIKIQNVFAGTIDLTSITDFISEEANQNQKKSILKVDDVLFSIAGTIGETSIVKPQHLPANTNQAFAIISGFSDLLLPKYLEFQLRSFVSQKTKEKARGGAMNNVSLDDLKHLELLLPPLPEQHRIVAKIEELFSELDKGIENLKTARAQLKVYRQALLKHAFEGKLTAQWRKENQDKLETAAALLKRIQQERAQRYQQKLADWQTNGGSKPKAPKPLPPLTAEERAELPELPEGWGWCKLGDFIDSIDAGKSFKCDEREPRANEIGVAKVSAVTWGEYDESESKTCTDTSKENEAYLIRSGDFILSRANTIDLVGACVIARKVTKKIMLSDKTLRIRFDGFSQEYFLQYLGSRIGRNQIMRLSTGNQESMRNIGQDRIRSIVVPICSGLEAEAVIETLAARLSEVDQLELTITTSLQQAEALRQSILKKAFSGQLVPQDPHDEPASKLLERIRTEREQSIKPKRGGMSS